MTEELVATDTMVIDGETISILQNKGSPTRKLAAATASLDRVLDLRLPIDRSEITQVKKNDYCLLVRQDSEDRRFFFETATEALSFQRFLYSDRSVPSPVYMPTLTKHLTDMEHIDGWHTHVGHTAIDKQTLKSLVDFAFEEYFYLSLEGQTLDCQISRWKAGVKWFNKVAIELKLGVEETGSSIFR